MQQIIWPVLIAFLAVMVMGPIGIPLLKKLKYGQTIYELGPQSHLAKQGVPTMGGVIIAAAVLVVSLAFSRGRSWGFVLYILLSGLLHGAIGFTDDYIKVAKKRSLGLTPKQKIMMQIVSGLILTLWAYFDPQIGAKVVVPYWNVEWNLGLFYIPLMILMFVFMINSANLLDGLDGLCASCSTVGLATFSLICFAMAAGASHIPAPEGVNPVAYSENLRNAAVICGAGAGACLGFLRFNTNPAKVIMGDTGSMFLGGMFVGVAMVTRLQLLLIPVCAAMIVSSLSVILQVMYCNMSGGKRLFKMSPLHHHFELCGMKEPRIVAMYTLFSVVMCLLAMLTL
ncbi:MAG: phospho-N-acetylmuramoyl-pentapeptide-transferase [Candidatus Fimadaptatus sp.]|nr:phospho-N-acetylmuramoyl-pentapeptide-transferase [Candidatus Fimadaptatus sp.]